MAKTAFFLILSEVVGTRYERDAHACAIFWVSFNCYCVIFALKDIIFDTFVCLDGCFEVPAGKQEGPIYDVRSSNKLFDDFHGFYSYKSMAYLPQSLCVELGS
jgi:hypothetical protein